MPPVSYDIAVSTSDGSSPVRFASARIASTNSELAGMRITFILMIAAFIAAMLIIKFFVAPAIYQTAGWAGVIATVLALLAVGKRLED